MPLADDQFARPAVESWVFFIKRSPVFQALELEIHHQGPVVHVEASSERGCPLFPPLPFITNPFERPKKPLSTPNPTFGHRSCSGPISPNEKIDRRTLSVRKNRWLGSRLSGEELFKQRRDAKAARETWQQMRQDIGEASEAGESWPPPKWWVKGKQPHFLSLIATRNRQNNDPRRVQVAFQPTGLATTRFNLCRKCG